MCAGPRTGGSRRLSGITLVDGTVTSIVLAALRDREHGRIAGDAVDETVLPVDPPRPPPCKIVLEQFGLADTGERCGFNGLNQTNNPGGKLRIVCFEITKFGQCVLCPGNAHQAEVVGSKSTTSPFSASAIDASRCARLPGARRCRVSVN